MGRTAKLYHTLRLLFTGHGGLALVSHERIYRPFAFAAFLIGDFNWVMDPAWAMVRQAKEDNEVMKFKRRWGVRWEIQYSATKREPTAYREMSIQIIPVL